VGRKPHGIPGTYPAHPETSSAATSAVQRRSAPNNTIATFFRAGETSRALLSSCWLVVKIYHELMVKCSIS